jgi:phage shock protein A
LNPALNSQADQTKGESATASIEQIQKDIGEIAQIVAGIMDEAVMDYSKRIEEYSKVLDGKIDDLKKIIETVSEDAETDLQKKLDDLKTMKKILEEKATALIAKNKGQFEKRIDTFVRDSMKKADDIRLKIEAGSEEYSDKMLTMMEKLEKNTKKFREDLKELQSKGADSWKEIKAIILKDWEELVKTLEEIYMTK